MSTSSERDDDTPTGQPPGRNGRGRKPKGRGKPPLEIRGAARPKKPPAGKNKRSRAISIDRLKALRLPLSVRKFLVALEYEGYEAGTPHERFPKTFRENSVESMRQGKGAKMGLQEAQLRVACEEFGFSIDYLLSLGEFADGAFVDGRAPRHRDRTRAGADSPDSPLVAQSRRYHLTEDEAMNGLLIAHMARVYGIDHEELLRLLAEALKQKPGLPIERIEWVERARGPERVQN